MSYISKMSSMLCVLSKCWLKITRIVLFNNDDDDDSDNYKVSDDKLKGRGSALVTTVSPARYQPRGT